VRADDRLAAARRAALGEQLRQLRVAKGWTQEELADSAGVDRKSISRFENGVYSPSLDRMFLLADALDIALSALIAPADLPRNRTRRGRD
jgi:transcriptional regulator with XRE-family HTH domain